MTRLKVVALISGGKDSLFSILHCLANGHDVVALANLHPPLQHDEESVEDMDSYMYQTVGHAVIPLYEEALGLPLYRQEIIGTALNQDKSYHPDDDVAEAGGDETESLMPLLQRVKAAHPDLNAVSTGAIMSDYQRTRVESVAMRLGLTPLSYLWQWPSLPPHTQASLLEDMEVVGQDSRMIKVASGGLDDSFLWQNVADPRTIARLTKAAQRFGSSNDGAVLGEGGEYETLAVDGPGSLWKARIVLEESHRRVIPGDAGSAALLLREPRLIPKTEGEGNTPPLRIPPLLDPVFVDMLERLRMGPAESQYVADGLVSDALPGEMERFDTVSSYTDGAACLFAGRTGTGQTVAAQMESIMESLVNDTRDLRPQPGLPSIAYTTIILRSMADFAAINPVYGNYFTQPIPPARVTVACADVLPDGCHVMLGVTCMHSQTLARPDLRHGLHVQSRSYWAPANIGPYSQAVTLPSSDSNDDGHIVYVAGQIPLVPASMDLARADTGKASDDFSQQTVLALQHLTRIGEVMKVRRWVAAIAFVSVSSSTVASKLAHRARRAWLTLFETKPRADVEADEAEDFDVWDLTHGGGHGALGMQQHEASEGSAFTKGEIPPMWVVEVDALPRGASIEWVGYGTTKDAMPSIEIRHLHYLLHVFRQRIL
ncbi:hypothetical protein LTR36_002194 [Oleoguttula mirabilis]|uniref:Diphthine--ammonia ligase n=1 Tax=Oleoguttula mirabilis TaxID=1507867 RepID=A0AAV9JKN2_9PEZI|nr:hypothetical protein LTR36_002194 [Oleoguttula mirabilis]